MALADKVGRATVRCEKRDQDRYGRLVAICGKGGEDLNQWLVANGWAVAYRHYSKDYVATEDSAKARSRGVWSGRFVMPWDWRRGKRVSAAATR